LSVIQALILGAIQGLTEFLPVSSSGHLTIFSEWLFSFPSDLSFDIAVHVGSLIAILIYFRKEVRDAALEVFEKKLTETLVFKIFIGSIPALLVAVFFLDRIERAFENAEFAASMLLVTAFLLTLSEFLSSKSSQAKKNQPGAFDAIVIGIFQAFAILPGISRSGSTIAGGLLRNLDREASAKFSFLLVIPAILGSLLLDIVNGGISFGSAMVAGFFSSLLFSLVALEFLLKYVRKHRLYPFAVYCAALAAVYLIASG
jgi:undecaprenyl-diphosphatase